MNCQGTAHVTITAMRRAEAMDTCSVHGVAVIRCMCVRVSYAQFICIERVEMRAGGGQIGEQRHGGRMKWLTASIGSE